MKRDSATCFRYEFARESDIPEIVRLESKCFPDYPYRLTVPTLTKWYAHNPKMFSVIRRDDEVVIGYSVIVPVSQDLFQRIIDEAISSLVSFPEVDVLQTEDAHCFHVEVFAIDPSAPHGAGALLLQSVARFLKDHATYVSASPITNAGLRLCHNLHFTQTGTDRIGTKEYGVFVWHVRPEDLEDLVTAAQLSQHFLR